MNYYYVVFTVTFDNKATATSGFVSGAKCIDNILDAKSVLVSMQDSACIEAGRLTALSFKDENVLIESVSKL